MRRVALTHGQKTPLTAYLNALERHFEVERVPPGDPRHATDFDGLVLAGGNDVNPALYGAAPDPQTKEPDDARDATELRLLNEALDAGMPVLAICRGLQLLNVARGGTLIQHLPTTATHQQKGVLDVHAISTTPGSLIRSIIGSPETRVNSRHHQAVGRLGEGLIVTAVSPEDNVIEAIEFPDRPFVVAVQWHPEDRVDAFETDRRLFERFCYNARITAH